VGAGLAVVLELDEAGGVVERLHVRARAGVAQRRQRRLGVAPFLVALALLGVFLGLLVLLAAAASAAATAAAILGVGRERSRHQEGGAGDENETAHGRRPKGCRGRPKSPRGNWPS